MICDQLLLSPNCLLDFVEIVFSPQFFSFPIFIMFSVFNLSDDESENAPARAETRKHLIFEWTEAKRLNIVKEYQIVPMKDSVIKPNIVLIAAIQTVRQFKV